MAKKLSKSDFISTGSVAQNRRAFFDYEITEKFTAGLELTGTEVKSLRLGHANINDAFGIEKDGELYISNMFIAEYANKGYQSHAEKRDRKLLLTKKEINNIIIGLGRGKKLFDKRETQKERDWNRDKQRILASNR